MEEEEVLDPLILQESPTRRNKNKRTRLHEYNYDYLPKRKRKNSWVVLSVIRARIKTVVCFSLIALVMCALVILNQACPAFVCGKSAKKNGGGRYMTDAALINLTDFKDNDNNEQGSSDIISPSDGIGIMPERTVPVNFINYDAIQDGDFEFDMTGNDMMVFLHIQKTGGTTFGKHLVQDVDLEKPCLCKKKKRKKKKNRQYYKKPRKNLMRCDCFRPGLGNHHNWLFSRYSMGWKCGLHADWTELTDCVDHYMDGVEGHVEHRRYFYLTFLRDPVARYLSEFRHVQRGATWRQSRHLCNGREPTEEELPSCYPPEYDDWKDVTLSEFMDCQSNLAGNRQTRMLSDLRLVNCYNRTGMSLSERNNIMLESAKRNLLDMAYFGLTELQAESQAIFEDTFNMDFNIDFEQFDETQASKTREDLDDDVRVRIRELNSLDLDLYAFAKELLLNRYREMIEADEQERSMHSTSAS